MFDMNGNIRRFSAAMALMVHGKSLAFAAGDPLHEHGMAGAVFMGPQVRNALRQVASDVDLLGEPVHDLGFGKIFHGVLANTAPLFMTGQPFADMKRVVVEHPVEETPLPVLQGGFLRE